MKVKLQDGKNVTDLHVKPTEHHQYFHFLYLVFEETLHMSRLCSNESDFERTKDKMWSLFVK